MSAPRLLDLFCGQGGAGHGYRLAGFDVTGIDTDPKQLRRNPGRWLMRDALQYLRENHHRYDAIHASPPCQRFTRGTRQAGTQDSWPDLVTPIREVLSGLDIPWVIENVPEAGLIDPTMLCGTMFDRRIDTEYGLRDLVRHRDFESNFHIAAPRACDHRGVAMSIAGHTGGWSKRDGVYGGTLANWRDLMEMPWANAHGCAEAIPPCYTEWIGRHMLAAVGGA